MSAKTPKRNAIMENTPNPPDDTTDPEAEEDTSNPPDDTTNPENREGTANTPGKKTVPETGIHERLMALSPTVGPLYSVQVAPGTFPDASTPKLPCLSPAGTKVFAPPSPSITNLTVTVRNSGPNLRNYKVGIAIIQIPTMKRSYAAETSSSTGDFSLKFSPQNLFDATKQYNITVYFILGGTPPSSISPDILWAP